MNSKARTLVKAVLWVLAGVDELLTMFPVNYYQLNNWTEYKEKQRDRWDRIIAKYGEKKIDRVVKYSIDQGYVKRTNKGFTLSEKGWQKVAPDVCERLGRERTKGPYKYMVIFDIPEEYRKSRDMLRKCVLSLGFKFFQRSVFITDSKRSFFMLEVVVKNCGLKKYTRFIEVKKMW